MSIKITADNIDTIKLGDFLVKYPDFGEPVDEIDYSDESKISRFKVIRINDEIIDLVSEVSEGTMIAGMSVKMGPLHKSKITMIEDNSWWKISN
jgi:hypothetical protein